MYACLYISIIVVSRAYAATKTYNEQNDSAVTLVDVIRDFSDSDGTFAKCYG